MTGSNKADWLQRADDLNERFRNLMQDHMACPGTVAPRMLKEAKTAGWARVKE